MSQFGSSALSASWSCYHLSFWMYILYFISGMFLVISSKFPGMAGNPTPARSQGMRTYTESYSLGENYSLDPRLDWQSVNVTDFEYKHRHNPTNGTQLASHIHHSGVTGAIEGALEGVWNGLKGIGKPQDVIITWYTGQDLLSPSCWSRSNWAPTDESFACALTLKGWVDRPKCFEFLELCSNKNKCIFVRVIDTCAGCAQGSRHVDLTKAAFKALADLSVGVTTVKMRRATHPKEWRFDLWGPQHL